jgi:hypothetical protein
MEVSRMILQKFDSASASKVAAPSEFVASLQAEILASEGLSRPQEESARTGAALIVAALPFIGLWLLLRWVWQDLRAIVRGNRAVADELSR